MTLYAKHEQMHWQGGKQKLKLIDRDKRALNRTAAKYSTNGVPKVHREKLEYKPMYKNP